MDLMKGVANKVPAMKTATDAVTGALKGAGFIEDGEKGRLVELEKNLEKEKTSNKHMEIYVRQLQHSMDREKQRSDATETKLEKCRERCDELNKAETDLRVKLQFKDHEITKFKETLDQQRQRLTSELGNLKQQFEEKQKEVNRLKTELDERETRIQEFEKKVNAAKKRGFWSFL